MILIKYNNNDRNNRNKRVYIQIFSVYRDFRIFPFVSILYSGFLYRRDAGSQIGICRDAGKMTDVAGGILAAGSAALNRPASFFPVRDVAGFDPNAVVVVEGESNEIVSLSLSHFLLFGTLIRFI